MGKKVLDLIKGVAITGATVGGVSMLADAQLVFANNLATDTTGELELPTTPPVETTLGNEGATSTEETAAATEGTTTAAEQNQVELSVTPEESATATAEPASTFTDEQLSESAATSLAEEESTLTSTSEFQSESLESTEGSLSEAIFDSETSYDSQLSAYEAEGVNYTQASLEQLIEDVDDKMAAEEELRQEIANTSGWLGTDNYYMHGQRAASGYKADDSTVDALVVSMIRFKLILDGEIDANYQIDCTREDLMDQDNLVAIVYYDSGGYGGHHYCFKYKDLNGVFHERYFDYITANLEGESFYKTNNDTSRQTPDNKAQDVSGINIIEKEATFGNTKRADSGENYQTYNRIGFKDINDACPYFKQKGLDFYTKKQYLEDKENILGLKLLSEGIESLKSTLSSVVTSASDSVIGSEESTSARAESLSQSSVESQSLSQYKSESLSDYLSASESASLSASESFSVSASELASMVAANSQAPSANNVTVVSTTTVVQTEQLAEAEEVVGLQQVQPQTLEQAIENEQAAQTTPPTLVETQEINGEEVPLAVLDDDLEETIEDEKIPRSVSVKRSWFAGTLGIVGGTATAIAKDKLNKEAEQKNK